MIFIVLQTLQVEYILLSTVFAVVNTTEDNYKDLINCVGEVSRNIFKEGEVLLVVFPIIEQLIVLKNYDACFQELVYESFNNSYCDIVNDLKSLTKYSENHCDILLPSQSITQVRRIHDSILRKLHSLNKWPIILNPVFAEYEYHFSEINSYVIILHFSKKEPDGVRKQLYRVINYINLNNLDLKGTFLLVITGDPVPKNIFQEMKILADMLEPINILIANTISGEIRLAVDIHEYKPYYLHNTYSLSTTWTKYLEH